MPYAEMEFAETTLVQHDEGKCPKGWRPYAALLAGFCGMANCWGLIMSFGPFFRYFDEHLLPDAGDSAIGIIGSVQSFVVLALSFMIGRLLDARLHRYVTAIGGTLTTLGHLCLSFTSGQGGRGQGNYGLIFLTQGVIAGLGMACFFVHSSQLAVQWFPKNRYFAVGVTSAGGAAGGLAFPPAISFLIGDHGFPNGVRIQAAVIGGISILIFAFGTPPPNAAVRPLGNLITTTRWIDREALKCKAFILFSLGVSFVFFGYGPLLYHVTEWAEQDKFRVIWFLAIMNGFSIIGRVGSAALASLQSRKLNPLLIHTCSCFVAALAVFLFWPLADEKKDALAFCVLFGILAGCMLGLPASGVAFIIPVERRDSLGTWTGMMWSSCCFSALAGPPIAGALRNQFCIEAVGYWAGANLLVAGLFLSLAMLANHTQRNRQLLEVKRKQGVRDSTEVEG